MRGTLVSRVSSAKGKRITPAYAGNTIKVSVTEISRRDHPRVCGEHQNKILPGAYINGSPPRVRGTRHVVTVVGVEEGITPAYAGNTLHKAK
mgnify:CR=1 FL=1